VAEEIETRLRQEEMQQLAYYQAEDAFDAVIDGDTLAQVALMTGKEVRSTEAFDLNGNGLDLDGATGFAQAAFDLQLQQISDIQQIDEYYFLIEVTEMIEPVQLPLESVTDRITEELERNQRRQAAEEQAKKLLEAVKSAGNLEKPARENNLEISTTDWFTRNEPVREIGRSDTFNRAAFTLTPENRIHPEVLQTDQGFFIIAFHDREVPDQDDIQENRPAIKSQLLQAKQGQYFQSWIEELKENSTIEINSQFINN
jgi:peptidyl-prolyl cis-trans isomerase D